MECMASLSIIQDTIVYTLYCWCSKPHKTGSACRNEGDFLQLDRIHGNNYFTQTWPQWAVKGLHCLLLCKHNGILTMERLHMLTTMECMASLSIIQDAVVYIHYIYSCACIKQAVWRDCACSSHMHDDVATVVYNSAQVQN
jgi:hypothetical protein